MAQVRTQKRGKTYKAGVAAFNDHLHGKKTSSRSMSSRRLCKNINIISKIE